MKKRRKSASKYSLSSMIASQSNVLIISIQYSAIASRYPAGLSWNVALRLNTLEGIREHLREGGDQYDQLANVEALIEAYRSGRLDWTGLVTYWSKGVQLCQPRPFDWDEFEAINKKHNGSSAFWVEGVCLPPISSDNEAN